MLPRGQRREIRAAFAASGAFRAEAFALLLHLREQLFLPTDSAFEALKIDENRLPLFRLGKKRGLNKKPASSDLRKLPLMFIARSRKAINRRTPATAKFKIQILFIVEALEQHRKRITYLARGRDA
ncbi:uncharacterized protein PHA67_022867 [Liasis olivaceus]